MTVQTEAPAAPASEPAAPAAPAPAAPAPPPVQPPAPAPQPPAAAQPPAQPAAPQQQPASPPADTTDWKAEAERLRAEAAQARQQAEQWKAQSRRQEQRSKANHTELQQRDAVLRQIAEKVGIEFDDRPDPEVLQQRLTERDQTVRELRVERAVYLVAPDAGVNPAALLDSREFITRAGQLDPDAVDFPSQVADLVKEASGQPRYQFQQVPTAQVQQQAQPQPPVQQAPAQQQPPAQPPVPAPPAPASGADFSGAPGGNRLWTQADLDAALERDRDGTIVSKAIDQGLLVNLGIGKPRKTSRR